MIIVLLGPPCAGKGTQAELLAASYNIPCCSTGKLFRDAVAAATPLGLKIKNALDAGHLINDDTVNELMLPVITQHHHIIFDGYPRSLNQAEFLQNSLQTQSKTLTRAIAITIDQPTTLQRMLERSRIAHSGKRADDNPQSMRIRLDAYQKTVNPLLDYYREREILSYVNGLGTINEVQERIKNLFAK